MKIELDDGDMQTIMSYFRDVQRQRGYNGPCFINLARLEEIHMHSAELTVQACLMRLRTFELELHQVDLRTRRDCLLELIAKWERENSAEGKQ